MTSAHLSEEALLDLLEGVAPHPQRAHVSDCLHCRARMEHAQEGLELARDAEIPEPSPLYWQSFRRQVDRRILSADSSRSWRAMAVAPWLAVAAAVVAVVGVLLLPSSPAPAPVAASVLPAWSALPAAEQDEGLDLVAAVLPSRTELVPLAECQDLSDCMRDLTDEESQRVAEVLREELAAGGSDL